MTVAPMAELFSLTQANPLLARSELEAWDHCTEQIIAAARERAAQNPDAEMDELYLRALAGSVISCGKAAMEVWFSRCGTDLSAESLSILRQLLIDSMGLLGSGFAAPSQNGPSTTLWDSPSPRPQASSSVPPSSERS
jgi:hypothetical protein